MSYRQADTLWKKYTPAWDLHQLRHTAISARAAHGYSEVELKRFSGHLSLRSLEVYIATTANCQAQSLHLGVAKPRQGGDRSWLVLARDIFDSVRACSQPRVAAALVIEPERGLIVGSGVAAVAAG